MPVKFSIQTSGNIKDEEISNFYYQRKGEDEKFKIIEKKQEKWIKEVEVPKQEGNYSYEIFLEADGNSESKEITIACELLPCPDVEEESESVFKWLKYDLKNNKIPFETIRKEKIEVYIDQNIIIPEMSDETVELGVDFTIIFQEVGEYHVTILQNGCTVRKVKYTVRSWMLKEIIAACAVLLVLVVVLSIIFRKKHR